MLDKCNYLGYNKSCNCGFSSSGRASPCQGEGSEFESRNPLQTKTLTKIGECFFVVDLCLPLNVRGGAEYNEAEGFYL